MVMRCSHLLGSSLSFLILVLGNDLAAQTVVGTIPVGGEPTAVAVNPVTHRIYEISCSVCPPVLIVIDGDRRSVIDTPPVAPEAVSGLAISPPANRIYTNRSIVDGATHSLLGTLSLGDAGVLAINPITGRLYDNVGRVTDLTT